MFAERLDGFGIVFAGHHVPGQPLKDKVVDGDSVSLRLGDESVLVRNVVTLRPGHFSGVIYGFEPSCTLEYGGLRVGQAVEFGEKQIFGCQQT